MQKQLRVLIVEDSEDDALLLRQIRKGGYDPAVTRVETLQALHQAMSDAIWDVVYIRPQSARI